MKGIMFIEPLFHKVVSGAKTETRRIASTDDSLQFLNTNNEGTHYFYSVEKNMPLCFKPAYKIGDMVFLKEPYGLIGLNKVEYKFDDQSNAVCDPNMWKNKMFMPEKYSRFTIQILDLRLERLHQISDKSCINEGIDSLAMSATQRAQSPQLYRDYSKKKELFMDGVNPITSYQTLWDYINKDVKWASNPLVWVYSFELLKK